MHRIRLFIIPCLVFRDENRSGIGFCLEKNYIPPNRCPDDFSKTVLGQGKSLVFFVPTAPVLFFRLGLGLLGQDNPVREPLRFGPGIHKPGQNTGKIMPSVTCPVLTPTGSKVKRENK